MLFFNLYIEIWYSVYFVLSNSNFLTFLKLTLKIDPLDIGDIVNESFLCLYVFASTLNCVNKLP